MPFCPHCNRSISTEAQALLSHCPCGAPMVGKVPPEPPEPPEPPVGDGIEEPPEVEPEVAGHARRRRGR